MDLTFHWMSGSPFAWRVMLALEYKGLKYESRRMDPSKGEHKTDDYLAINPRGKVPALQDGDFTVRESLAILTYLENIQPEPALLGSTAQETAGIWQTIYEIDNYAAPAILGIIRPILFGAEEPDLAKITECIADLRSEFKPLDELLSGSKFLAGDEFSAADIAFVPIVQYLIRAVEKQTLSDDNFGILPLADHFPNIAAWSARVEAMPSYQRAYPPHWRD